MNQPTQLIKHKDLKYYHKISFFGLDGLDLGELWATR
jgi:hypothetical protein